MSTHENHIVRYFSWEDYAVFASTLLLSTGIGVYFGFNFKKCRQKNKQNDNNNTDYYEGGGGGGGGGGGVDNDYDETNPEKEFLMAGGKMNWFPVALSLLASFLSSITIMGQPAEAYLYGPGLWLIGISSLFSIPFLIYFLIPFFRNLNTSSAYEYFGQRFGKPFQFCASVFFTVQMLLFLALVLYAPALAFNQVSGIDMNAIIVTMYFVCIFYTTVGGIKAVIWTDAFQILILYTAVTAVLVMGTLNLGGFTVVWNRNMENFRGNFFDFDFDPTKRYSFWASLFGCAFLHLSSFGANQLQIQRYLTVPSMKEIKNILYMNVLGWTFVTILTAYAGMLIFAKYYDCDPLMNNQIKSYNELFPLYVMDVLGEFKGFPGLFVAGIFSAGLSTVSTGVNSLAAIWFSELEGTRFKKNLSPKKKEYFVKGLALLFGLSSFGLVFIVPFMGNLVPIAVSISGFFSGSFFALFILGIFVPFVNQIGAFSGLICGVGFVGWLSIGAQISLENGYKVTETLPLTVEGCSSNISFNMTSNFVEKEKELAFILYRISFMWYSLLSIVITAIVGMTVSVITNYLFSSSFQTFSVTSDKDFNNVLKSKNKKEEKCNSGTNNPTFYPD